MTTANCVIQPQSFSPHYQMGIFEQLKNNIQDLSAHILNTALILTYLNDNGSNVPPSTKWEIVQTTQRIAFLGTTAFAIATYLNKPIKLSHRYITITIPATLVLTTIVVTSLAVLLIFKYYRWPQHTESFCRKLTRTNQEPTVGNAKAVEEIKRLIKDETPLILLQGDFGVGKSTTARQALSSFSSITNEISGKTLPVLSFELAPIDLKTTDSYNYGRILSNMLKRWAATPNIHYVLFIDEFSSINNSGHNSPKIIELLHEFKKIYGASNISIMGSIKTAENQDAINNATRSLGARCIDIEKTTDSNQIIQIILRKLILSQATAPIYVYSKHLIQQSLDQIEDRENASIRNIISDVKSILRTKQDQKYQKYPELIRKYSERHITLKKLWVNIEIELGKNKPHYDTINEQIGRINTLLNKDVEQTNPA